ncbi:MAG TPA: ABC transporter permease [Bryobacteraceae bacterium]|nr:ABC transporter permease [Bryobacteraceae bacterium]
MDRLRQDLVVSFRRLRKSPGFTAAAIVTLALGIGANATIFSVVNAIVLRPLAVHNPHELVFLNTRLSNKEEFPTQSYPNYRDYRDQNQSLAGLAAYRFVPISISRSGTNARLWGYEVTGNYFDMLGVQPATGRLLHPDDDLKYGAHPVAVLGYGCWQKRFGGDPSIVGNPVKLNGLEYIVVGVTPPDFFGTELIYTPDIYVPIAMQRQIEPGFEWIEERTAGNIFVVGRLKPGVTMAQAEANLSSVAARLAQTYPKDNGGMGVSLSRPGLVGSYLRGAVTGFAAVLMTVAGMVLLIACVNLASMLLARSADRRKDTAIRLALGAGRGQLIRQLLTESLVLSLAGGVAGVLLAAWLIGLFKLWTPPVDFPIIPKLIFDTRLMIFSFIASLVTGLLFGLVPALQSTRSGLTGALKSEAPTERLRRWHLRDVLVAAQVALSVVLLIGSVLVVRSLQHAMNINLGLNPSHAAQVSFDLALEGYTEKRGAEFQRRLIEKVRSTSGIEAAALADMLPLSLMINNNQVLIEGQPVPKMADRPLAAMYGASPGYFRTLGTRLLAGREFEDRDVPGSPRVAIVNQAFVKKLIRDRDPIGKRFRFSEDGKWLEIVGVAEDGKYRSLSEGPTPVVFRPILQTENLNTTVVARSPLPDTQILDILRRTVLEMDPSISLFDAHTLTDHLSLPLFPARVAAGFLGAFGLLAVVLAATGVYGMMAYAVSRRTREIGIRMALGASAGQVLGVVMGRSGLLVGIGAAAGIAMALAAGKFFAMVLYGVSDKDPVTYAIVIGCMAFVALAACWLPARRAIGVDPSNALRSE